MASSRDILVGIEGPVSNLASFDPDHLSSKVVSASGYVLETGWLTTNTASKIEMLYWSKFYGISMDLPIVAW